MHSSPNLSLDLSALYTTIETDPSTQWLKNRKRAHTKVRMLEAAIYLLETSGWLSISTNHIAKLIGISQPSFYSHYANLEACLEDVLGILTEPLEGRAIAFEQMLMAIDGSAKEVSLSHFEWVVDMAMTHQIMMRLFFKHRRASTALGARLLVLERRCLSGWLKHTRVRIEQHGGDVDLMAPQAELFSRSMNTIMFGLLELHTQGAMSRNMCAKVLASQHRALSAHIFPNQHI